MAEQGLLEVDTPLIASAAPSERALDCLAVAEAGYLVPSPEHGLKRLLAAGMGAIYQLSHVFRAGEVGRWHNPEFTMLEWYREEAGLIDMMSDVDALLQHAGAPSAAPCVRYCDLFLATTALHPLACSVEALALFAKEQGIAPPADPHVDADRVFWLDLIMSLVVQPTLGAERPVFVSHFPMADAVLIQADDDDPALGLRFECYWQGVELANGAVELRDAALAAERMDRERRIKHSRGGALPPLDEHLLAAMQSGLPRCAGVALGVDRLLALLTGAPDLDAVLAFCWARR